MEIKEKTAVHPITSQFRFKRYDLTVVAIAMFRRDAFGPGEAILECRGIVNVNAALRPRKEVDWKLELIRRSIPVEIVRLRGNDRHLARRIATLHKNGQSKAAGK